MAEAPSDAVDGDDKIITFFVLLWCGGEQFQLGWRERQSVADQAHMADAHPPGPGQQQGAPG